MLLAALALVPLQVHAHSVGSTVNGWHDGFNHPLHGWDHLVVMIGVGLWAAQQRGRAVWLIPLTFVGVMTLGGIVGASGAILPGVELGILSSVAVFSVLVAKRIHFRVGPALLLVGFFAFFHGFAHGAEMPGSASMVTFALGFILATLFLHAIGLVTARLVTIVLAFVVGSSTFAQQSTNNPAAVSAPESTNANPILLPDVVVTGRQDSLLGIADSAGQGTTGAAQLATRPILRSGEILETVPGVIITQHAGGGKANQYFLRGFNLDHGTDFANYLDGMPLNLPSHAHGEGYSDMNIVIPEYLYLDQQSIDTTTPAGKLMLQMCGAFAEFERSMLQARIAAGLRRAVANGAKLGRPLNDPNAVARARVALAEGIGINRVAKMVGLSNGTVAKLKAG